MIFSSMSFLYVFLPIVLISYYICPKKHRNLIILISSYIFYFCGEPRFVVIIFSLSLFGYICGLILEKYKNEKISKWLVVFMSIICCIPLLIFKYYDFFIKNFNEIFNLDIKLLKLALPIGISFYTFQILSYIIDVYNKRSTAQRSFISFASYVSFFPQLIAGPIVRYDDISKELENRKYDISKFSSGVNKFIIGLSKKVIIADTLSELIMKLNSIGNESVLKYWIIAISFTVQIYFDFSGYSDMAIGLGRMMGFNLPRNFNYPYISKSLTEFWRRWHITLGSWFRDYVYIPLGGNRVSTKKMIFNILLVWLLTGFWHGAEWNFILWGVYYGILLIIEKIFLNDILNRVPNFIKHIYTIIFIIFGFVIFRCESINEIINNFKGMMGLSGIELYDDVSLYYLRSYIFVIIIGAILSTPILKKIYMEILDSKDRVIICITDIIQICFLVILLLTVSGYIVDGSFSPFLYFRF